MNNEEIQKYNSDVVARNQQLMQERRDAFIAARTEQERVINAWLKSLRSNPKVAEQVGFSIVPESARDLIPHAYEDKPYEYKAEIEQEINSINEKIETTNKIRLEVHKRLLSAHEAFNQVEGNRNGVAGTL